MDLIETFFGADLSTAVVAFTIAGVMLALRIGLHFMDVSRIEYEADELGWRNVSVSWAPFAPGWFWEKNERHYLVRYLDDNNTPHQSYCKTSLLTGVYWKR